MNAILQVRPEFRWAYESYNSRGKVNSFWVSDRSASDGKH